MNHILVILLRYLGDVLLATPVLSVLRGQYPRAKVTMLVNRGTETLLSGNPDVDDVLVVDRRGLWSQGQLWLTLRRGGFDCVLDLTDGDRSAWLARLTGARVRIGMNREGYWRGWLYTQVVRPASGLHRIDRNLEFVKALGVGLRPSRPPLVLNPSMADKQDVQRLLGEMGLGWCDEQSHVPLVMIHPGARYWFKAWRAERFGVLARRLIQETGCRIFIGGSQGERDLADGIERTAGSGATVIAGRTTVTQYAALLARCQLFIGNDNGPMHMASALGVPIVALFGPSDPAEWGPRSDRAVVVYKGLDCRHCFHPTCERGEESCMNLISVDEVFDAACRMLPVCSRVRAGVPAR